MSTEERDRWRGKILTSVCSAQEVDPSWIEIGAPILEHDSLGELRGKFERDAEALVDHLQDRLPGGTLDALLRKLLEQRALLLVAPLPLPSRSEETVLSSLDSWEGEALG